MATENCQKYHDIASAEGLAESSIDIVVGNMPFLSKADTRLTEQNLASFSNGHAVLRGDFVGTDDVVNVL
jgi:methylase of polypeptide subunit release factors